MKCIPHLNSKNVFFFHLKGFVQAIYPEAGMTVYKQSLSSLRLLVIRNSLLLLLLQYYCLLLLYERFFVCFYCFFCHF